jgi:hypothetical protein
MLLLLLLYRTTLGHQMPVHISYDGFVAAKLAIVILSFVAFGFLCDLLVFILRLVKIRLIMKEGKERRAREKKDKKG